MEITYSCSTLEVSFNHQQRGFRERNVSNALYLDINNYTILKHPRNPIASNLVSCLNGPRRTTLLVLSAEPSW